LKTLDKVKKIGFNLVFLTLRLTWCPKMVTCMLTAIGTHSITALPENAPRCLRSTVTCGKTPATVI